MHKSNQKKTHIKLFKKKKKKIFDTKELNRAKADKTTNSVLRNHVFSYYRKISS